MITQFNKLIHSSIFITVLCWGTAYTYGWGTALTYGYPWWYIEVGGSNIATSLAYVLVMTILLAIGYFIGLYLMRNAISRKLTLIGSIRILTILSILFLVSMAGMYIFIGRPPLYFFLLYLCLAITLPCVFHRAGTLFSIDYRHFKKSESFIFTLMGFLVIYFLSFAFIIGLVRPYLYTDYAVIHYEGKPYYILKVNNNDYILAEKLYRNDSFVFLNRTTLKGYCIKMVSTANN
ncbi:hypothetical protein PL75_01900 [Neisseria arctica]|uniref:Uncharacterized protein n=1 Tax=Neisseria arctica TaxID=1470200 RepID=A0A0J0YUE1_9NEIS|nr:hypothetical protein [Neisseria arctica]KLT73720.1 hypothetical protein PL75_01900 [Neisseria arctica]UOO85856.1 hypothetical protein LVJ86_06325 [Neisseria arctica]